MAARSPKVSGMVASTGSVNVIIARSRITRPLRNVMSPQHLRTRRPPGMCRNSGQEDVTVPHDLDSTRNASAPAPRTALQPGSGSRGVRARNRVTAPRPRSGGAQDEGLRGRAPAERWVAGTRFDRLDRQRRVQWPVSGQVRPVMGGSHVPGRDRHVPGRVSRPALARYPAHPGRIPCGLRCLPRYAHAGINHPARGRPPWSGSARPPPARTRSAGSCSR